MAAPPQAIKIRTKHGKSEITLLSNVDRVNYTLEELINGALRDVGKALKKKIAENSPVKTGLLKKSWQTWVLKSKKTGEQQLLIGVYSAKRAKEKELPYAHHAHLILLGHATVNGGFVEGNNFFLHTVQNNIDLVRDIEAQYLSYIEDENKAIALAEEEENKSETD